MIPRLFLAAIVSLILMLGASSTPGASRPAADLGPIAGNEVLVELDAAAFVMSDAALGRWLNGTVVSRLPEIGVIRLRLEGETPAEALLRLHNAPLVRYVEPNLLVRSAVTPTDPFYSAQSEYLNLIGAPAAWDVEKGNSSVLVAVLDTGVFVEHPDLVSRVWTNTRETANNGLDDDGNGCIDDRHGCSFVSLATVDASCPAPRSPLVDDDNGHGTFVSGIIGAQADNGIGISGAAPNVTILPVKILDCTGGGSAADAAAGILYAARAGARVANISFGADGDSNTLRSAIREAHDRYGMVIVAATGNEGVGHVTFPARLPETIAVGSSGTPGDANARSAFSNWGPEVVVVAPGLNIVSTVPPQFCDKDWFCVEGQPYAVASGTSFAAPLVSAMAALLISHNPFLPPEAVRNMITMTADPLADGSTPHWDGAGRIRMRSALDQPRYYLGVPGVASNK